MDLIKIIFTLGATIMAFIVLLIVTYLIYAIVNVLGVKLAALNLFIILFSLIYHLLEDNYNYEK